MNVTLSGPTVRSQMAGPSVGSSMRGPDESLLTTEDKRGMVVLSGCAPRPGQFLFVDRDGPRTKRGHPTQTYHVARPGYWAADDPDGERLFYGVVFTVRAGGDGAFVTVYQYAGIIHAMNLWQGRQLDVNTLVGLTLVDGRLQAWVEDEPIGDTKAVFAVASPTHSDAQAIHIVPQPF